MNIVLGAEWEKEEYKIMINPTHNSAYSVACREGINGAATQCIHLFFILKWTFNKAVVLKECMDGTVWVSSIVAS